MGDGRPLSERSPENQLKVYRGRDFCREFFPKAHALKTCGCYKRKPQDVLIIQPRSGRQIRRV